MENMHLMDEQVLPEKADTTEGTMTVYGTTASYFSIMNLELAAGRFLKKPDVDNHSYVIVISADTAVEFFGRTDAEGETLTIDGKSYTVVGVLSEDENLTTSTTSTDSTETVNLEGYIPYSTYSRMADDAFAVSMIYISSAKEDSLDEVENAVENIMTSRLNNDEDAYSI